MGDTPDLTAVSKFLSYVLRHHPDEINLTVDEHGWASVDQLIRKAKAGGRMLSPDLIRQVISQGNKQRFVISDDGDRIRAAYGHSISVDLQLNPK